MLFCSQISSKKSISSRKWVYLVGNLQALLQPRAKTTKVLPFISPQKHPISSLNRKRLTRLTKWFTTATTFGFLLGPSSMPTEDTKTRLFQSLPRTAISCFSFWRSRKFRVSFRCVFLLVDVFPNPSLCFEGALQPYPGYQRFFSRHEAGLRPADVGRRPINERQSKET